MPALRLSIPERQMCFTLQECADQLGCSREYVRQLQVSALKKCYFYCWWNDLRLEDLLSDTRYQASEHEVGN